MKRKRIVVVVNILIALLVLFWCAVALYNRIRVHGPINKASGMTVSIVTGSLDQDSKTFSIQLAPDDVAYFELSDRVYYTDYLPSLSQAFSTGSATQTSVWLTYTDGEDVLTELVFYENGLCQIDGKTVYVFPRGDSAKELYQKMLKIAQQAE